MAVPEAFGEVRYWADFKIMLFDPAVPPGPGAPFSPRAPPASYPWSQSRSLTSRLSPSYRSRSPTSRLSPSYRSRSHFSQRSSSANHTFAAAPEPYLHGHEKRKRHYTVIFCKTCTYHPPLNPTECLKRHHKLRAYAVRY